MTGQKCDAGKRQGPVQTFFMQKQMVKALK